MVVVARQHGGAVARFRRAGVLPACDPPRVERIVGPALPDADAAVGVAEEQVVVDRHVGLRIVRDRERADARPAQDEQVVGERRGAVERGQHDGRRGDARIDLVDHGVGFEDRAVGIRHVHDRAVEAAERTGDARSDIARLEGDALDQDVVAHRRVAADIQRHAGAIGGVAEPVGDQRIGLHHVAQHVRAVARADADARVVRHAVAGDGRVRRAVDRDAEPVDDVVDHVLRGAAKGGARAERSVERVSDDRDVAGDVDAVVRCGDEVAASKREVGVAEHDAGAAAPRTEVGRARLRAQAVALDQRRAVIQVELQRIARAGRQHVVRDRLHHAVDEQALTRHVDGGVGHRIDGALDPHAPRAGVAHVEARPDIARQVAERADAVGARTRHRDPVERHVTAAAVDQDADGRARAIDSEVADDHGVGVVEPQHRGVVEARIRLAQHRRVATLRPEDREALVETEAAIGRARDVEHVEERIVARVDVERIAHSQLVDAQQGSRV